MTIIDHIIVRPHAAPPLVAMQTLRVRWSCVAEACSAAIGCDIPPSAADGAVVMSIEFRESAAAVVECWVECAAQLRRIFQPQRLPCDITDHDGWRHFDIRLGERRLVSLTIDLSAAKLVYCHTSLLGELGLPGGSYDGPTLQMLSPAE